MSDPDPVLQGTRVLDFGRYIAAPYCGALLADLGADVIRVERLRGGEDRSVGPVAPDGPGAMFLQCNRGKRSMALNPSLPEGRAVVRRLVATADVVIVNLPPSALAAMGLEPAALLEQDPRLVVGTVDAFGPEGPWAGRVGFDAVGQAMSGAMHLTGGPDLPMKAVVNDVDFTTALSLCSGILAALLSRERTGRGRHVRATLMGSALTLNSPMLIEQAVARRDRVATGNRSQLSGPSDTFRTRDGFVLVQVVGRSLFERWARAVGAEDLLEDPRFASDEDRGDHGELLSARMAAFCEKRTSDEILGAMDRAGVPSAPVLSPQAALEHPQIAGGGYLEAVEVSGVAAAAPLVRSPFDLGGGEPRIRGNAPELGADTVAVLREIGYGDADVESLRRSKVI